jgi:hypothetical protein
MRKITRLAAKGGGLTVLGVCGFLIAALMATASFAGGSSNSSTTNGTTTTTTRTTTTTTTTTPVVSDCHETVNPAGNPAVGDNGFPNDPYGGDAVPGGTSTKPGTNGNGPSNSDGFYLVSGFLFSDDPVTLIPYWWAPDVPDNPALVEWPLTTIKYTEWGNSNIKITDQIGGPKSEIKNHVQAPGDLWVGPTDDFDDAVFCGVPPPPFKP